MTEADLFCKNTISILNNYFNDPDYHLLIVTVDLVNSPEIQFHFLKSYIVKNADIIFDTIHEAADHSEN